MKNSLLFLIVVVVSAFYFGVKAESQSLNKGLSETPEAISKEGEEIFVVHADDCLALMEEAAKKISITGVAIVAYIPGDLTKSWISKMKVVDRLATNKANLAAIAYSKAAEMAVTLQDSGNEERKAITGEFGYQGGVLVKVKGGYLIASFSGGTGQEDADVAKEGIDWLAKYY